MVSEEFQRVLREVSVVGLNIGGVKGDYLRGVRSRMCDRTREKGAQQEEQAQKRFGHSISSVAVREALDF